MITFDPANTTASRVGPEHGLSDAELEEAADATGSLCARYAKESAEGKFGFARLPYKELPVREVEAYARERAGAFRNLVQVGIGGSALGATAIHGALCDRFHNERGTRPRYYALDNVDPEETSSLLEMLDPKETLFHVVTKSGDTTETMAGFLAVLDRIRRAAGERWTEHLVLTTDPEKGFLRAFAKEHGVAAFSIPPDVGGRFSVLSPVGLLPAALLGVDVRELIEGAADAHEACESEDPRANPAYRFALTAQLLDARRGKRIHVMMPYARALRDVADWFRQLWAESLGKNGRAGPTPVLALGTTDQHSQVQLYAEGPNDKYVIFVEVSRFRAEETVPSPLGADAPPAFLQGKGFSGILSAMKAGTEKALVQARRPNATVRLEEISPRTLGALFFFLEAATLFAGWLYGVDPFDQPGVEAGKKAAFSLLGKPGYPPLPPPSPGARHAVRILRAEG